MGKVTITNSRMSDPNSGLLELTSKNQADLESLNGNVFVTDDPSLILILTVLHGQRVVSTGYIDGFDTTHFVFEKTDRLNAIYEDWDKIAQDDCDNHVNLFCYVAACLGEPERASFSKLLGELKTSDKEVYN